MVKGNIKPINVNGTIYETSRAINRFIPHLKKGLNIEYINKTTNLGAPFKVKLSKSIKSFYTKENVTKNEYLLKTKESVKRKFGVLNNQEEISLFIDSLAKQKAYCINLFKSLDGRSKDTKTTFERRVLVHFLKNKALGIDVLFNNLTKIEKLNLKITELEGKQNSVVFGTEIYQLKAKASKLVEETLNSQITNVIDLNILRSKEFISHFL